MNNILFENGKPVVHISGRFSQVDLFEIFNSKKKEVISVEMVFISKDSTHWLVTTTSKEAAPWKKLVSLILSLRQNLSSKR